MKSKNKLICLQVGVAAPFIIIGAILLGIGGVIAGRPLLLKEMVDAWKTTRQTELINRMALEDFLPKKEKG